MKKRLAFKCWNCKRKYTLFKEITDQQELIVPCPFCAVEAVVQLDPFKKKIIPALKRVTVEDESMGYEYQFPEVIPTQKPEQTAGR